MTRIALMSVVAVCLAAATTTVLPGGAGAAPAASLSGVVQSGGTESARPLGGVEVTLYEATSAGPTPRDTAMTDADGAFLLTATSGESSGVFYVTADVGRDVEFVAVLGSVLPPRVTINELTTVAAGYAMAQFTDADTISGDSFALQIAAGMSDNLVDTTTGASSEVLLSSPNADETNSLRSTRSLANLLAACLESHGTTSVPARRGHGFPRR